MSIMYPGLKPGVCPAQAGTPTALLRSLGPPPNNLFQPIRRNSATGSNLSLSTTAMQVATTPVLDIPKDGTDAGNTDAENTGILAAILPQPIGKKTIVEETGSENESCLVHDDRTMIQGAGTDTPGSLQHSEAREHRLERVKLSSSTAGLAHQRTRSNEIDYISRAAPPAASGPSRASLPSPPGRFGNSRAFRPVSACGSTTMDSTSFSDSFSYMLLQSQDGSSGKNLTASESSRVLLDNSQAKTCGPIARVSSEGQPTSSSSRWSPARLDANVDRN